MSATETQSVAPEPGLAAAVAIAQPHAELLRLAQDASSRHGYLAAALHHVCEQLNSPYAALYVSCGAEVIEDEAHRGATDPGFWRPALRQFLTDSLTEPVSRAKLLTSAVAKLRIGLLASPLIDEQSGLQGAIVVVIEGGDAEAKALLPRLDSLASVMAAAAALVGAPSGAAGGGQRGPSAQALARAAGVSSPEELAFAITNNLRNKLGCEQVALGQVRGRGIRILAISGLDDVQRRTPGVAHLRAAMEECLDQQTPVIAQHDAGLGDDQITSGHRLHQQWRAAAGGDAVATIPLVMGDECTAVVSLRRRADEPFRRDQIDEIRKLVEPFAPALLLVQRAQRGLVRHTLDALNHAGGVLFGRGHLGMKFATAALIAATAWFCCGTLDYEVAVPATVIPAQQRHVAAPTDGVLAQVSVKPGDVVKAGDVLCTFDTRDLELEKAQLEAELAVLDHERRQATADNSPAEAKLAQARERMATARLEIVERRLAQCVIRAPFDGIVVDGEPDKRIGAVLAQGEPLLVLARSGDWTLELDVPEYAADELQPGLAGRFASHARPDHTHAFGLARMAPGAEIRDQQNVYVGEATLSEDAPWLRPGMEGVAKVHVGPRRVWWIALHNALDYMRLNFWL